MNQPTRVSLDVIEIASPCPAEWDEMRGDDRVRFCGLCQLNVYNLSEMNRSDAEEFISHREGRTCIRIYRRADGKILTRDCPIGLRAVRRRLARMVAAMAAIVSGLAIGAFFGRSSQAGAANANGTPGPLARFAAWLDPPIVYPLLGDIVIPQVPVPIRDEDFATVVDFTESNSPSGGSIQSKLTP